MRAHLRHHVAALLLLAPAAATLVAQPAAAQQRVTAPQIQSMQLNADEGLDAGSRLDITVHGSPGGRAVVNLGKTNINVALRETQRGIYRGAYTVRRADRIDPTSVINVRLTRANVTTRHAFTYPPSFQALAMGAAPAPVVVAEAPRIERFVTVPVGRLEPGRELRYRVHGLPGATVTLEIPGVIEDVAMREVRPGLYEATYTVRGRDDLGDFRTAVATLRSGNRWVTSRLDRAYMPEVRPPGLGGSVDFGGGRVIAAPQSMALQVMNPINGAIVDAKGDIMVQGRTAPFARVHVRVDAVPPVVGHMMGVAQVVFDETVQADREGYFDVAVRPRTIVPHMRYDVTLAASRGDQTAETRITVRQRG